jgi:hypothetical protein
MWSARAALLAFVFAGVTTNGFAASPEGTAAPPKDTASAPSQSLDGMVGKRLIAIDGSTIALMPAEGGLAREIVGSNGAVQKTMFEFINERLGTVSDARNAANVIGVFRRTSAGIEAQYADGSSETLAVNPSGGLTIETISFSNDSCMAWYPEGHVFSLDERRAALAQFATRLGLADPVDKKTASSKAACAPVPAPHASDIPAKADAAVRPVGLPRSLGLPPAATTTAAAAAALSATALKQPDLAPLSPVEVRNSEVHPIDPIVAQPPQVVASNDVPMPTGAADQRGASTCLSVETDGMHWGFRNHCGYSVQFAYCQMSGADQLASCRDGTLSGSVAGNGFGSLVADEGLKGSDAVHDFRWVACQGGAGEVIPRLDQTNPPSGRCVR